MIKVIENRFYRHTSGRIASIYGAAPWLSEAERAEWSVVSRGWTWSDTDSGTVGLCRAPAATREEAQEVADKINRDRAAAREAHRIAWAPVTAPIEWVRSKGNDGAIVYRSGESYSIRKVGPWYQCEDAAGTEDLPAYRSLAKAKDWCARCIRSERKDIAFA